MFRVAFYVVVACIAAVESFTIEIPEGTTLPKYRLIGYRQQPYFSFGIYSKDSFLAKVSGHTDRHPHVEIFIDAKGGPSQYFQVFLYNADIVEGTIMPSTLRATTPCMDVGQERGVAFFSNMTPHAFALNSGGEMIGPVDQYPMYSVREGIFPMDTGLYVVTMNACRYTTNAAGDRVLKVNDWSEVTLRGSIVVRNPFGYLPGQLYGFIPAYSALLVLAVVVLALFGGFAFRVGKAALLLHQWGMLAVAALNVLSYTFLLSYYSTLNEQNVDRLGVLVCGTVLVAFRNTLGALLIYLICYGYKVVVHNIRPAKVALVALTVVSRLSLNLTEAGMLFSATEGSYGMWGTGSMQEANLGWKLVRTFGIVVDVFIGIITAGTLFCTLQHLRSAALKRRLMLYQRTAAVLGFGIVIGASVALAVFNAADGPLGQYSESQWKVFWLPPVLFEVAYFFIVSAVLLVWLPRKGDLFFLHAETVSVDQQCAVGTHNTEDEDDDEEMTNSFSHPNGGPVRKTPEATDEHAA